MEYTQIQTDSEMQIAGYTAVRSGSGGGSGFSINFKSELAPEYLKGMLRNNRCRSLAAMSFVKSDESIEIVYDVTGFLQYKMMSEMNLITLPRILRISINILTGLKECENYLLNSDMVPVRDDAFFVNPATEEVKLIYLPGWKSEESLRVSVIRLIADVIGENPHNAEEIRLLTMLKKQMFGTNPDIREMIRIIRDSLRDFNTYDVHGDSHLTDTVLQEKEMLYSVEKPRSKEDGTATFSGIYKRISLVLSKFFTYNK